MFFDAVWGTSSTPHSAVARSHSPKYLDPSGSSLAPRTPPPKGSTWFFHLETMVFWKPWKSQKHLETMFFPLNRGVSCRFASKSVLECSPTFQAVKQQWFYGICYLALDISQKMVGLVFSTGNRYATAWHENPGNAMVDTSNQSIHGIWPWGHVLSSGKRSYRS